MVTFLPAVDFFSASFHNENLGMSARDFFSVFSKVLYDVGLSNFTFQSRPSGLFSYQESFNFFRKDVYNEKQLIQSGLVAFTETQMIKTCYTEGFYFSLSAMGCRGVDFVHLVKALLPYCPSITRIDIAVDWFDGLVDYELVKQLYYEGSFISGGRSPRFHEIASKVMCPETGSLSQIGSNTFYVGKRGGAKLFRGYEKGLQLLALEEDSHPFPDWFRCEVEFRNKQCEIPLNIVENLDGALLGAYPNFFSKLPPPNHISQLDELFEIIKLKYKSPEELVSLEHFIYWCRESYGGLFNVLLNEIGLDSQTIVDLLLPEDSLKKPKRLLFPISSTKSRGSYV